MCLGPESFELDWSASSPRYEFKRAPLSFVAKPEGIIPVKPASDAMANYLRGPSGNFRLKEDFICRHMVPLPSGSRRSTSLLLSRQLKL